MTVDERQRDVIVKPADRVEESRSAVACQIRSRDSGRLPDTHRGERFTGESPDRVLRYATMAVTYANAGPAPTTCSATARTPADSPGAYVSAPAPYPARGYR